MSCCHHCCSNCCCSSSCSVPAEQRHLCLTLFSNAQLRWQLREFPLKPPVPVQLPAAPFLFLTLSLLSKGWKPGPQCKVKGFNWVGKMWRGCKTGDYRCWRRRAGDDWWNIRLGRAVNYDREGKMRQAKIQMWVFRNQSVTTCYLVQVSELTAWNELQVKREP